MKYAFLAIICLSSCNVPNNSKNSSSMNSQTSNVIEYECSLRLQNSAEPLQKAKFESQGESDNHYQCNIPFANGQGIFVGVSMAKKGSGSNPSDSWEITTGAGRVNLFANWGEFISLSVEYPDIKSQYRPGDAAIPYTVSIYRK